MTIPKRPVNIHKAYHAHIYFDAETLEHATRMRSDAEQALNVKVGRLHQKLVGPHTRWSCQLLFSHKEFDQVIPWLDQQRKDLSILVHPVTGDDLQDHTEYAYWLGDSVDIDLSGL
ncbi:DOPA 4,5-dioxygenase family protein [Spongorhabdus nitratireducens]